MVPLLSSLCERNCKMLLPHTTDLETLVLYRHYGSRGRVSLNLCPTLIILLIKKYIEYTVFDILCDNAEDTTVTTVLAFSRLSIWRNR